MLNQIESNYDCANAGKDLHQLKQELEGSIAEQDKDDSTEWTEAKNRIQNQISFIQNKCDIH